jgi:MoxR-like ATPase
VLFAGRKLENSEGAFPEILADEIRSLQLLCRQIDLAPVLDVYINTVFTLRNAGISISDRRAVKMQNIIAASALICGRQEAVLSDLWVLKHIWDTEEQIEILEGIINHIIEKDNSNYMHPQAMHNRSPNPEELMKDVKILAEKWQPGILKLEEQNMIKDKLRFLQTRCDWIKKLEQKQFVQLEIDVLWKKMLQTI